MIKAHRCCRRLSHSIPAPLHAEASPLSQWLYAGMRDAGLPVELLEPGRPGRIQGDAGQDRSQGRARHRPADAARLHCKSLPAQEVRSLLTARKLLQTKNHDVEMSLRGVLRGFGLKVGPTTPRTFAGRILRTGRRPHHAIDDCRGATGGARYAFGAMAAAGETPSLPGPAGSPRAGANDHTGPRRDCWAPLYRQLTIPVASDPPRQWVRISG